MLIGDKEPPGYYFSYRFSSGLYFYSSVMFTNTAERVFEGDLNDTLDSVLFVGHAELLSRKRGCLALCEASAHRYDCQRF